MKKYLNSLEEITKALKEGKEVFEDGAAALFKYVDGFLIRFENGKMFIGAQLLFCPRDYYCYEDDPLKLEKGKLYKTRDGRKAFVSSTLVGACGSVENWDKILKWDDDGTCLDGVKETDIIEEWREE